MPKVCTDVDSAMGQLLEVDSGSKGGLRELLAAVAGEIGSGVVPHPKTCTPSSSVQKI